MVSPNNIIIGQRFGLLTVFSFVPPKRGERGHRFICLCDCGKQSLRTRRHLVHDRIKSCGCLKNGSVPVHGHCRHGKRSKTWMVWRAMRQRCYRHRDTKFPYYGGRGIKVCERWESFSNFLEDMGEAAPGLTLDRINNDGNYEPSNCRWATRSQQARNTSITLILTYRGVTKSAADWADEVGLKAKTLDGRIRRGWTLERALKTPLLSIYEVSRLGTAKKYPRAYLLNSEKQP